MKRLWLLAVLTLVVCGAVSAGQTYTYIDLVNKLTDMEGLAVLPVQGETSALWSSYDRASRYDEATGKYVGWDANGDGRGIIRTEDGVSVVAEMEGPGCIWRTWSAMAGQGHVKIYLDGKAEPVVDLPFIGYFDHKNAPFTYPGLVHEVSKGFNNYVPIPFQKSCKITMDKDWGAYYHFNYSKFPAGTTVPTFTRNLSADELAALDKADRFLRKQLGTDPAGERAGQVTETKLVSLDPGEKTTVSSISGARAITGIWVKMDTSDAKKVTDLLRDVSLRISWDGEKSASVWTPLGDFFGTGPGVNEYKSLPLGMTKDGFYSYWYMPFAEGALVDISNDGGQPFEGQIMITHAPITKPIEELGRFHAKWHRDAFLPTEPERWIDWPMVKATGRGRFCGVGLQVWNPRGGWWGEGDEKFFVDGEKFPSTIGTGSEDYFGYAWCWPGLFQNAYHDQTRNDGDNFNHIAVNRWHITDNVPFQKSFEGDIEKYFPNKRPTLYAATGYWYLEAGGDDPYKAVPVADRTFYVKTKVEKVAGALEGEELKQLGHTGGDVGRQGMEVFIGGKWSGDAHLWWTNAKPGDKLDLALPVSKTGRYTLKMVMTKAADYGIVQIYLDGAKLGGPVDLYHDGVVPTGVLSLGTFDLTSGDHKLTAEIVGKNEKSSGFLFGLDYVKLVSGK